jgi:hypothetical protein
MIILQVLTYQAEGEGALVNAGDTIARAGFRVVRVDSAARFRHRAPGAICAVVLGHALHENLLPNSLDGVLAPPIVLVSPLRARDATRSVRDPRVVHRVLAPAPRADVLVAAVTTATIAGLLQRLDEGIKRLPGLAPPLRAGLQTVLSGNRRRVKFVARFLECTPRTLENQWRAAFGHGKPKLTDFCRGIALLRALSIASDDPDLPWNRVAQRLDIEPPVLRRAAADFAGRRPSQLDLHADSGAILARVSARVLPARLLAAAVLG